MDKFGLIALLFLLSRSAADSTSTPGPEASPSADEDDDDNVDGWQPTVRLPDSLRPIHYNITIKPYIYEEMVNSTFKYDCNTTIYLECHADTDKIRLHASLHFIVRIALGYYDDDGSYTEKPLTVYRDLLGFEIIEIDAGFTLRSGRRYVLTIESYSHITNLLNGLYWSPYKDHGETKYIITTMMEPTCARLVFPCFDEPDFKAVFLLNIYRKEGLTCIANLQKTATIGPDEEGFYLDVFDQPRTFPISTYLVAFACGEIDYLESEVDGIRFRTYARKSVVNLTEFALDIGMKTLKHFQDYFQIPYPLPKQDMIGVPTMSFNAMEHPGMVTYREGSLVYEAGVNSELHKEWVAILIAHEMSHQWFGNLVSPNWWDDLWLNEGFATYMMFQAIGSVLPEWNMMNVQILDLRGTQNVFSVDDKLTSHPVYVEVSDPAEIMEIFDLISYAKGSALICMLNFFLGEETFKNGLTRYLNDFTFDTATHEDLWRWLEMQAIEDGVAVTDVKQVMDTWLLQMNYPVVTLTRLGPDTLQLSQSAFLIDEEERTQRADIHWEIPVTYTTDTELNFKKTSEDIIWLHKDGEAVNVTDDRLVGAKWVLANTEQYGFYRVNYEPQNWLALIDQLRNQSDAIHPINRAQIINDAWNLARAGLLDFEIALQTIDYLDKETDFVPWKAALRELKSMGSALQLTPLFGLFEDFMKKKLETPYLSVQDPQSHLDIIKHAMLTRVACKYGIKECVDDAMDKFQQWMVDDDISVDPNIKDTVYCVGVAHGGREAWEHVLHVYKTSDSPGEKMALLAALACTKEPWILAKLLDMTLTEEVFSQNDKFHIVSYIAGNPVGRLLAWDYLVESWDTNFERFGIGLNLFSEMVKTITAPFNKESELRRVELFKEETEDLGTARRQFETSLVNIRANIAWLKKHYGQIEAWLQAQVSQKR